MYDAIKHICDILSSTFPAAITTISRHQRTDNKMSLRCRSNWFSDNTGDTFHHTHTHVAWGWDITENARCEVLFSNKNAIESPVTAHYTHAIATSTLYYVLEDILMPLLYAQTTYINAILSPDVYCVSLWSMFTLYCSTCAFVICLLIKRVQSS